MRIQPRPSLAWAIGIGYAILFLVLEKIVGIDYDRIGTTTDTIVKGIVVSVAIGALVGFSEEITYRGLPPVGFRGGTDDVSSPAASGSCSNSRLIIDPRAT